MRYRVLPYRQGSRSAAALAEALGGRVLRLEGSTFRARADDVVINWGNTTSTVPCTYNGDYDALKQATNKLEFFRRMDGQGLTPEYWSDPADIPDNAFPVVCRTVLAGHSGEGIVIADTRDQLVRAPLYVQYVKKNQEFRIHVGKQDGQSIIISEQRKVARTGITPQDWRIRNLANGFVFQRQDISVPDSVRDAARRTMEALPGVDFGAVDVIFNERRDRPYVLECNTAPGLEGTTIEDYSNFFRRN